jgi:hypothetical protein
MICKRANMEVMCSILTEEEERSEDSREVLVLDRGIVIARFHASLKCVSLRYRGTLKSFIFPASRRNDDDTLADIDAHHLHSIVSQNAEATLRRGCCAG